MTNITGNTVMQVDSLVQRYGATEVLRDVSFRIERGEFTGLIGTNGSGKTTLFRAILGLDAAAQGTISFPSGPRSIGYVPQRVNIDPTLPIRIRDLVDLGIDGQRLGWRRATKARRRSVDSLIESVGLGGLHDRRVGELSGGELQRALIAHALASEPSLLLLDEPLANLDPGSSQGVVNLLDQVAHEHHVAVLLSAHEFNQLLPVLDRVVYLANGRAVNGTVDEVVRGDVLSSLYGHHVDVLRVHGRLLVVTGEDDESAAHDEVVVE